MRIVRFAVSCVLASTTPLAAQHTGNGSARPSPTAPKEAAQFAFLVGQWDLVVTPKASGLAARIHGVPKLLGTWKAWRVADGFGVEDELRIVDGSGNPNSLSHALRLYSASESRWIVTGIDAYRGRVSGGSGTWTGAQMVLSGEGTDAEGKPSRTRSRFTDITPTSFTFVQDRSSDGGKSWDEAVVTITAKRTAAAAPR